METLAKPKFTVGNVALLATIAAGALLTKHYSSTQKASGAERLAEALLDTTKLREASDALPKSPEVALAACAAYTCSVALRAAEAIGLATGTDDPPGYSRTHKHPFTGATASVLTEQRGPETPAEVGAEPLQIDQVMTYAVTLPDVAEVRGTRRVGALHLAGLAPAHAAPDVVQISIGEDYTAQIESEFEVGEHLFIGRTRLFGASTLRDNRGNAGRINIGYDGAVSGTVTRGGRVIGRFEGRVASGIQFKQYQIEPGA